MSVSAAQKKASKKYISQHDRVEFLLPKGGRKILKEHCELLNISVNQFCSATLKKQILKDRVTLNAQKHKNLISPKKKG